MARGLQCLRDIEQHVAAVMRSSSFSTLQQCREEVVVFSGLEFCLVVVVTVMLVIV